MNTTYNRRCETNEEHVAHLSLALLGPLRILVEGRPVDRFAYTRSQALLAYLAVEVTARTGAMRVVGLLWPELPDTAARVNLRQVLADLRQVIGDQHADPPLLLVSRETIQLNPQAEFEVTWRAFARCWPPARRIRTAMDWRARPVLGAWSRCSAVPRRISRATCPTR